MNSTQIWILKENVTANLENTLYLKWSCDEIQRQEKERKTYPDDESDFLLVGVSIGVYVHAYSSSFFAVVLRNYIVKWREKNCFKFQLKQWTKKKSSNMK